MITPESKAYIGYSEAYHYSKEGNVLDPYAGRHIRYKLIKKFTISFEKLKKFFMFEEEACRHYLLPSNANIIYSGNINWHYSEATLLDSSEEILITTEIKLFS